MTQEQFYRDFGKVNDFYAAAAGLQRPGGMVIDRDGVPTCDVEAMGQWGWQLSQGVPVVWVKSQIRQSDEWKTKHANDPAPPGPPIVPIAGRIRCENGRFKNDAGWFAWHGISQFSAIHLVRTGQEGEFLRQRNQAIAGRRTVARVLARAVNLFDLNHTQPGYYDAVDHAVALNAEGGMYTELCVFPDAQSLSYNERREFLSTLLLRFGTRPEIIWQLTNEGRQNGFTGTDDPDLLSLAAMLEARLGHRDFSIDDPPDGDTMDASAETIAALKRLAGRSNILVMHPSRKGGATPEPERLRRWVDHLTGFHDALSQCRQINSNVCGVLDEPMGHASQQWVPLPGGKTYERECDADVALAAAAAGQFAGWGYDYHRIAEQDDGTPGLDLIGAHLSDIPIDPSWHYLNDSWADSPTHGTTWTGGKCRTWTNGQRAFVIVYGLTKGDVTWANGFAPIACRHDGQKAQLWECHRLPPI